MIMNYYQFKEYPTKKNRYILDFEVKDFLAGFSTNFLQHESIISVGTIFYRAQKGCDWEPIYQYDEDNEKKYIDVKPAPYSEVRMRPRAEFAREGRANPKGISYMYLAMGRATAISEIRPWVDQEVTVAKFKALQELKLIDFTKAVLSTSQYWKLSFRFKMVNGELQQQPLSKEEASQLAWYEINEAFSKPIEQTDDAADYALTQLIAELVKSKGYDGIIFKSSVGTEKNIVLFNQDVVAFHSALVCRVKGLEIDIEAFDSI